MKMEILSGQRLKNTKKSSDYFKDTKSSKAESGPASLPIRLGASLASGLDIPSNLVDAVTNLVSSSVGAENNHPNPFKFREGYKYLTGTTEEQLKSQGFLENIGQRAIEKAPLAAAYGGIPGVAIGAAGAAAGAGLQQLGAPDWLSNLGELGSDILLGAYNGKVPTLGTEQKAAYGAAEKAAEKAVKTPIATKVEASFGKLKHSLSTETNKKFAKVANNAQKTIKKLVRGHKLDPQDAFNLRKSLNRDIFSLDSTVPKHSKPYLRILKDGINEFFADYSAQNPEFYKQLSKADKLTELKHMNSYVADWAADHIPVKALHKVAPWIKGGIQDIIEFTLGTGEKILRQLGDPIGRDLYFNMTKAAFNNSPSTFLKSARDLIDFFSGENKAKSNGNALLAPKKKNYSSMELLSGSRL